MLYRIFAKHQQASKLSVFFVVVVAVAAKIEELSSPSVAFAGQTL